MDWLRYRVDTCARRHEGKPKLKYLLPLDDEIAERIKLLAKAIHRRATSAAGTEINLSETSDTSGHLLGEGRAARTVALQPQQYGNTE